jgi:hypothetical protein
VASFSRLAWAHYHCRPSRLRTIQFGGHGSRITVADVAVPSFQALADALQRHGIKPTPPDTGAYNCRMIGGTNTPSPHSYGAAVDVNWQRNPAHSRGSIPANRHDPRFTEMSPAAVRAATGIRTKAGKQVFQWGGAWTTFYDPMHFDIVCAPGDLLAGIEGAVRPLTPPVVKQLEELAHDAARGRRRLRPRSPRMRGRDVTEARAALGLRARGVWGRRPVGRVKALQAWLGIGPRDSRGRPTGEVDRRTWEALMFFYFARAWGYA